MQFVLLRRTEPGAGLQFAFDTDTCHEVLLGRDPSCHVLLDPQNDTIAAIFHARIQPDPANPSGLIVIDMNSRNGTFVNGVAVQGQAVLPANSSLLLGWRDGHPGPELLVNIGQSTGLFQPQPVQTPPAPVSPVYTPQPGNPAGVPPQAATPPRASSGKWWEGQLPGVPSMQQGPHGSVPGLPRNVNVTQPGFRWTRSVVAGISVLSFLLAVLWISAVAL